VLHLHPLTLEDVLQRDPREKLESFPKLGYYFISFRATESQKTRDRRKARESRESVNGLFDDGGTIGEANVYLVVFEKGICAVRILSSLGVVFTQAYSSQFHFADISGQFKFTARS